MAEREVDEAVYGYWSKVMSTPSARASAIMAIDSGARPKLRHAPILWWVIWTGIPASRPIRIVSSIDSKTRSPSLRMWEM